MKPFKKVLFGDEQSFCAVCEYDLSYREKDYLFGAVYCVCYGQLIGDDSTVVLPTVTYNLESIISDYDYKLAASFSKIDKIELFNYIRTVMNEKDNPDYDLQMKFQKIRIDISSIIFDGFAMCLISDKDSGIDNLTWKGYNLDKIFSYTLDYGMVFKALSGVCDFVKLLQNDAMDDIDVT